MRRGDEITYETESGAVSTWPARACEQPLPVLAPHATSVVGDDQAHPAATTSQPNADGAAGTDRAPRVGDELDQRMVEMVAVGVNRAIAGNGAEDQARVETGDRA
ncbi:hypothetical protein LZK98_05115 [Sphingomonas cannabina]|nr:hypothetical protein [Sphingomonas cannabina]UIJ46325.1 hypothetical protein LZK98_05115 [Sphingomonas cannabina]